MQRSPIVTNLLPQSHLSPKQLQKLEKIIEKQPEHLSPEDEEVVV